ncbi:hypothetical protein CRG98_002239, partial [Punica granatum]
MASTACFLHPSALTAGSTSARASSRRYVPGFLVVCRAQKPATVYEESGAAISRRLALTVLIGAAAVGSRVSPADAAYGEA